MKDRRLRGFSVPVLIATMFIVAAALVRSFTARISEHRGKRKSRTKKDKNNSWLSYFTIIYVSLF